MAVGWIRALVAATAFLAGLFLSFLLGRIEPPRAPQVPELPAQERAFRHRRIICMSPAVAEIAFAVGAGDRVVGVSQHTRYPPAALDRPTCGGFFNPNFELILGLAPDLIITQGEAEELRRFASRNGMNLVSLSLSDLDSIFAAIRRVGDVLEVGTQAELVCAEMRYRLAKVRASVGRMPRIPVLLVTGREPGALSDIYTVGPGSFLHDLIRVAGGRNAFADLGSSYGAINKEALIERSPRVIVELHGEGGNRRELEAQVRRLWRALAPLPAVREGRVYVMTATYALIPGPRVVRVAEQLSELIHGVESR
ncbi:MAG: helical backbone metal receptor [Candidatus Brocadiaceae bacterium]|jgi:iron complex transport system substrate-binding protein